MIAALCPAALVPVTGPAAGPEATDVAGTADGGADLGQAAAPAKMSAEAADVSHGLISLWSQLDTNGGMKAIPPY